MMGFLSFLIFLSCNNFQTKTKQKQQLLQRSGKKLHFYISIDLTRVRIKPHPTSGSFPATRISTSRQVLPKRDGSCSPKAAAAPVACTSRARAPASPAPTLFTKIWAGGRGAGGLALCLH